MQNPALTIGLSPQPDVLRSLSDKPGFRGRGLLARFCYTLPVSKVGKRTLNGPPVPKGIKDLYRENMISLLNIVAPENNAGDSTSFILKLSADALREWTEFAQAVEKDIGDGGRLEFIKDWGSKLSGTAIRIAGLMHCAHYAKGQPWQQPISQTTMEQALTLAAILAEHALIVFDLMGADEGLSAARKVWRWIERQRLETFTARDCFQALKGTFARMGNLRPAFDVLIERHYIFPLEKEQSGPGRPSEVFYINPKIVGGWS
jgi:hypothetical protein